MPAYSCETPFHSSISSFLQFHFPFLISSFLLLVLPARGPVVTIGTLWEVLFVDTVLYPSDYGQHQGAHICIYLEWGLHDEYGEPGEAASDVSSSWRGGALWEAVDLGTVAPAASL